jgi:hypothetical protein
MNFNIALEWRKIPQGVGGKGRRQREEMAQTMYAHMNK